jgi:hypothetical protein
MNKNNINNLNNIFMYYYLRKKLTFIGMYKDWFHGGDYSGKKRKIRVKRKRINKKDIK